MVWCCDGYLMAGVWLKEEKSIERDDLFVIEMNLKIIEQRALVYLQQTVINTSSSLLSVSSSSLVLVCSRDTPTHTPTHIHTRNKSIHCFSGIIQKLKMPPLYLENSFTSKHRTSIYISHLHDLWLNRNLCSWGPYCFDMLFVYIAPLSNQQLGVLEVLPEPETCLWKRRVLSVSRKQH